MTDIVTLLVDVCEMTNTRPEQLVGQQVREIIRLARQAGALGPWLPILSESELCRRVTEQLADRIADMMVRDRLLEWED